MYEALFIGSGIHGWSAYNEHEELKVQIYWHHTRNYPGLPIRLSLTNTSRVYLPMNIKDNGTNAKERLADKVEIAISLDSELLEQIRRLTNDPSKVIEAAIRQWLRAEIPRDDELTRTPQRKPVPPRGEWND